MPETFRLFRPIFWLFRGTAAAPLQRSEDGLKLMRNALPVALLRYTLVATTDNHLSLVQDTGERGADRFTILHVNDRRGLRGGH